MKLQTKRSRKREIVCGASLPVSASGSSVIISRNKYYLKLKDPRWQQLRLKTFERDEWTCQRCGDNENTLCVHHLVYKPDAEPWDYELTELLTICQDCHDGEHEARREEEKLLISELRRQGYFASEINDLAISFHNLPMHYPPEVIMSIITWSMRNFKCLEEAYFDHIMKK